MCWNWCFGELVHTVVSEMCLTLWVDISVLIRNFILLCLISFRAKKKESVENMEERIQHLEEQVKSLQVLKIITPRTISYQFTLRSQEKNAGMQMLTNAVLEYYRA